ncbi:hypothetical protein [Streptomyces sp. Tu 2975]|uniref:hypothetical protein n=1 Tax=Streptomyces sp. Tu 2975 TaxID=2676871 RepID=UPI001FC9F11D|nr:hypothetical protein [Streptomyces sp. Tu 2975]
MNGFDITGWGMAVPERVVSSTELAQRFGVDENWIVSRCGIHERRAVGPGQTTASLAVEAGRRALDKAGLSGGDIAHLIVATATPNSRHRPRPRSSTTNWASPAARTTSTPSARASSTASSRPWH